MFNLGLTVKERKAFEELLQASHSIDIRVVIMDLDHNALTIVSDRLMDGQVTVDATSEITRSLDLDLLDPTGALHLDSKSPDDGAIFADRMIRVRYSVIDPTGSVRYTTPVFTGPITKIERNGAAVNIEAQGKETFGLMRAWNEKTYKKGYRVTTVIRAILEDIIGETKLEIPDLDKRLPRNVSVGEDKYPWKVAKRLASSIGYQLFYDGRGHAVMRKKPTVSSFTFNKDEGGSIKTEPIIGFNIDNLVNAVEVFGKKPLKEEGKTTKKQPHARVVAKKSHPMSPWSLGRNGGPRYIPLVIEEDSIETDAEALARARRELKLGLLGGVEVMYDTLVIPHLEELDIVTLNSDRFSTMHVLRQFAIPLTAAGTSSIGYVRNVKTSRRALKQRSRKKRKL